MFNRPRVGRTANIPLDLQRKVDAELEPRERVVWMDTPIPRFFTPMATGAFIFGIPWTAFSVFWICGASGFKLPNWSDGLTGFEFFPLFGLPFLLIGLVILSAPLWAYRQAFKRVYVITDRRAITIDGDWGTTIRSYKPANLQDVYRTERKDGTGDVIIGRNAWRDTEEDRQTEELGFLRIRNPKEVERMLNTLAEQAQETIGD